MKTTIEIFDISRMYGLGTLKYRSESADFDSYTFFDRTKKESTWWGYPSACQPLAERWVDPGTPCSAMPSGAPAGLQKG